MKLVFSHGEKGGVGKSTIAAAILDRAITANNSNVTLIEGDTGTPDVGWRFQGVKNIEMISVPLNRVGDNEEAVMDLLSRIEDLDSDLVVVNLPASAGETLDPLAPEIIVPVADDLGIQITTVYAIGPTPETVRQAEESTSNGLVSISDRVIAVVNEALGRPGNFAWTAADIRQHWLSAGAQEFRMPALAERVAAVVRNTASPFSTIADGAAGNLRSVERSVLKRWIRAVHEIADAVIADEITREENGHE